MEGIVRAVCVSARKGTVKRDVVESDITLLGMANDAHAGNWHRQVSLLSFDKEEQFNAENAEKGVHVLPGDFGENLLVEGIDFRSLPIGTKFSVGGAVLQMTQIGKECHTACEIRRIVGNCIMPVEGVFAKVLRPGHVKNGDVMTVEVPERTIFKAAILTASDKGSRGEREDLSGPAIREMIEPEGYMVTVYKVVPDDQETLESEMKRIADEKLADIIFTTGGTGFSLRDVTPEATIAVSDRLVPGIPEAMRAYSMTITNKAMLSRAAAGIRKQTLIVNMPGSPKAVKESLEFILPPLRHGLEILLGEASECARK